MTDPEFYVLVIVLGTIYLVPTFVAWRRDHHQAPAILALNLLLGWTILGWVAAFIWALTMVCRSSRREVPTITEILFWNKFMELLVYHDWEEAAHLANKWIEQQGLRG